MEGNSYSTRSHWQKYKIYYLVGGGFLLLSIFILVVNSSSNHEIRKVNQRLTRVEKASGLNKDQRSIFDNLRLPEKNEYSGNFKVTDLKKQDSKWIVKNIPSFPLQKQVQRWTNAFKYLPDYRAKHGPEINRHVLLSGPTGSGKSYLADQFCENESCVWSKVRFETEIWKGSSLKKQKAALETAKIYGAAELAYAKSEKRTPRPAVLVIEEIDSVGIKDMSGLGSSAGRDEVNGLLQMFDEIQKDNLNIVLIATTNYPDALESALVRPGRFGRRIEVPYPTDDEIENLVRYVEKTMKSEYGYKTTDNQNEWAPERKNKQKVVKWPTDFWNQAAQSTKEIKKKHSKIKIGPEGGQKEVEAEIGFAFPDLSQIIEDCLAIKSDSNSTEIIPDIKDYRQHFTELIDLKVKDWSEKGARGETIRYRRRVPTPTKDPEKEKED